MTKMIKFYDNEKICSACNGMKRTVGYAPKIKIEVTEFEKHTGKEVWVDAFETCLACDSTGYQWELRKDNCLCGSEKPMTELKTKEKNNGTRNQ